MVEYDRIQKEITVYVPGNLCNMRCSYCYVSECLMQGHEEKPCFQYPMEHMIKAFRPERIGGLAYFVVIGAGETLLVPEVVPFVKGLLQMGHVVEVVTNNTVDKNIDALLEAPKEDLARLIIKCSLHWKELVRLKKVDSYFASIRKIVAAGASSYPFVVICDEYMDVLDEICDTCKRELGVLPHCTPCVTTENRAEFLRGGTAVTSPSCTPEFVEWIDNKFHSKIFTEAVKFLDVDVQKIFCYAGKHAFGVGMQNGHVVKCHNVDTKYNFFENIDEPFECEYVGCECGVATCSLQYGLFSQGMVPEVPNVPSYGEMLCDREGLFTDEIKRLMGIKICRDEDVLSESERMEFLMDQITEKNQFIERLVAAYRQGEKPKTTEQMVNEILAKVDANKVSYDDLCDITHEHMVQLYKVCRTMEQGEATFRRIVEKIMSGLFVSHSYEGIDVLYDEKAGCAVTSGLQKMSVTRMIVCDDYCDDMQMAIQEGDYHKVAEIYHTQIKNW